MLDDAHVRVEFATLLLIENCWLFFLKSAKQVYLSRFQLAKVLFSLVFCLVFTSIVAKVHLVRLPGRLFGFTYMLKQVQFVWTSNTAVFHVKIGDFDTNNMWSTTPTSNLFLNKTTFSHVHEFKIFDLQIVCSKFIFKKKKTCLKKISLTFFFYRERISDGAKSLKLSHLNQFWILFEKNQNFFNEINLQSCFIFTQFTSHHQRFLTLDLHFSNFIIIWQIWCGTIGSSSSLNIIFPRFFSS